MVDLGYLNEFGFLYLYRGEKYYLLEFYRRGKPRTWEEIFNRVHSLIRYVIECTFRVWKKRWKILHNVFFSLRNASSDCSCIHDTT